MTTLVLLESAVLGRLRDAIPATDLAIEPYPEKPGEYSLLHPNGALLLFVRESRYGGYSNGAMRRTTRFIVTLLLRNFKEHQSAYDWIDAVRGLLFGYAPDGWQPIQPVSEHFVSEESGIWQYDMLFEADCLATSQFNLCSI